MRGYELLDKMELIDPAFIETAGDVQRKKRTHWLKWGAAAACVALAVFAGCRLWLRGETR